MSAGITCPVLHFYHPRKEKKSQNVEYILNLQSMIFYTRLLKLHWLTESLPLSVIITPANLVVAVLTRECCLKGENHTCVYKVGYCFSFFLFI